MKCSAESFHLYTTPMASKASSLKFTVSRWYDLRSKVPTGFDSPTGSAGRTNGREREAFCNFTRTFSTISTTCETWTTSMRTICRAGFRRVREIWMSQCRLSCCVGLICWNLLRRQICGIMMMWVGIFMSLDIDINLQTSRFQLEAILSNHGIVVISRHGSNPEKFIFESDLLTKYKKNITIVTNWVANEVSSTLVRRFISRNLSVKYLLDDSVIAYINQNSLYRSSCGKHFDT